MVNGGGVYQNNGNFLTFCGRSIYFMPDKVKSFLIFTLFLPLHHEINDGTKASIIINVVRILPEPTGVLVNQV